MSATKNDKPVLQLRGVRKFFPVKGGIAMRTKGWVKALDTLDLDIPEGQTIGVVGESGCGKTTLGKVVARLYSAEGKMLFTDRQGASWNCSGTVRPRLREMAYRRDVQMVFQDPFSSLDPRMTVGDIVREPLDAHQIHATKAEANVQVAELLRRVGLGPEAMARYPHEFSGGQRQRIAIARAIALRPRLVVCDEPTSALDVSVQSQVVNLLKEVQAEFGMAYLFISHNLDLVYHMADRILVMYLGNVMEEGSADEVFLEAKHPYTKALMDSIPSWDPETPRMFHSALGGEPPSPVNVPSGCPFHPRCPLVIDRCRTEKPQLRELSGKDHQLACHLE